MILAAWAGLAHAGLLAGPVGAPSPTSGHTQVVTWRNGDRTSATFRQDVSGAGTALAWITPVPGPVSDVAVAPVPAGQVAALDAWSAPRVLAPTCDQLSLDQHLGCGESPDPASEIPVDRWLASAEVGATGTWEVSVLDEGQAGQLTAWLADHGLALPASATDPVAAAAGDGDVFVAALWNGPVPPDGSWLPPLRIEWTRLWWELPLRAAHPNTVDLHDAVVWTLTSTGGVKVENYPKGTIEADCMPPVGTVEAWSDQVLSDVLPASDVFPQWLEELASPGDACVRCPGALPDLAAFDWTGGTPEITRMRLRYSTAGLDVDPTFQATEEPSDPHDLAWVDYAPEREFAFPVCGEGYREDPQSCPGPKLRSRTEAGCATGPAGGTLAVLLAVLVVRRRRAAIALLAAGTASAESPRSALAFEVPVWSTVRLGDDVTDARGAPSLDYPTIGADGRVAFASHGPLAWSVAGGVRAWAGRASLDTDEVYTLFGFYEPHAGLDATWGRLGDHWLSPSVGGGAELAIAFLDPSIWRVTTSAGPLLRARVGAWLGHRPRTRTEVSFQVSGIPRFDRRVVSFPPETGLPGWTWHPGTANLAVVLGGVFGTTSPRPAASSPP